MSEKFWIVWRESGSLLTRTRRHEVKDAAIDEATRFAQQTGERYFVLEVIGMVAPKEVPVAYSDID